MNQEITTISSAVLLGVLSGAGTHSATSTSSTMVKVGVNSALAIGFGYLSTKVTGSDTKANILRGGALGVSIAHGFGAIREIIASPTVQAKIKPETAVGKYLNRVAGLGCADGGLEGYFDANGNYHDEGLGGYIPQEGGFVPYGELNGMEDELNGYEEGELNGYEDELNGYEDGELNGMEQDGYALNAYVDLDGNVVI
jgi:hypothetical protein